MPNGRYWIYVNKKITLIAGFGLSIAGMWYAFRGIQLDEVLKALAGVDHRVVLAAIILMVYSAFVRAQRWRYLVLPQKKVPLSSLFSATMIGYFGNAVLPLRMGEIMRAYSLGTLEKISQSNVFGTIILDRLLDMVGLVGVIILFTVMYPLSSAFGNILLIICIVTTLAVVLVYWLGKTKLPWDMLAEKFPFLQRGIGKTFWQMLEKIIEGVTAIRDTHHSFRITMYTVYLWVIYYVYLIILVKAMHLELDWVSVGILLITTTLSISVPSAPGYIGTYHAVAVAVLTQLFEVDMPSAQAFAVVMHAVGYIPFIIIGAYYFIHNSFHFADMKDAKETI